MHEDRENLIRILERAGQLYREKNPRRTLLGANPDNETRDPVSEAIQSCSSFKLASGNVLYSGGAGFTLHSDWLATKVFDKGIRWDGNVEQAVDWLLRLLHTREADGFFKTAVWGFSVDDERRFSDSSRLMPFSELPNSYMKSRILERAKPCYDRSMWLSPTYFDVPRASFVKEISKFPYIASNGTAYVKIDALQKEARDFWEVVGAASIGHPLAIGCWFEYVDDDLDVEGWQNPIAWILPEIPPRVAACTPTSGLTIQNDLGRYDALPEEVRSDLLRSMNRFTLSQCRYQLTDRILDLALAFEIAVSGGGDQAPPSWKVSVRSAQLIGGTLDIRQKIRNWISELYKLRNKATHGGSLKVSGREKQEQIVLHCSEIYRRLIQSFLLLGRKPDWNALELEARTNS